MARLEHFRRLIGAHVPTCPHSTLHDTILAAASEFCANTKVWREKVTKTLDAACTGYAPTLPGGAVIHDLEAAWYNGSELTPAPFDSFTQADLDVVDMPPHSITQRQPGSFRVVPRQAGTLILSLILKPPSGVVDGAADAVIVLPDFLLHQHGEAIAAGGLARAQMIPSQPWSNPNLAMAHQARFLEAMAKYQAFNLRGQQRVPLRTRPQWV